MTRARHLPWTVAESDDLRRYVGQALSIGEIATILGRRPSDVRARRDAMRLQALHFAAVGFEPAPRRVDPPPDHGIRDCDVPEFARAVPAHVDD